jgi:imidazolonepropionase-like amidohydrolase
VFLLAAALLIHNVTVIDPASRTVRVGDVCVVGERIADVRGQGAGGGAQMMSSREQPPAPRALRPAPCDGGGATQIDATGQFLIPGLADMHAHLFEHGRDEKGNIRPRYDRATLEQALRAFLDFGVTTIRDPGAETEAAVMIRNMVAKGALAGPDITTCGRILNSSNFDPEPFQPVHSEEDIRREIRWQKAAGVDCIKVYSSMPPDFARVAIDEAHKNGLPIIGHLQRTTWTEAARMGIDGVEHAAPWSSAYVAEPARAAYDNSMFGRVYWLEHLDEKAIDEMVGELAKHHVVVDPTLMAMVTKLYGDDPRWTENPDLKFAPPLEVKSWKSFSFTSDWTPEQYRAAHAAWPKLLRLTKKLFDAGVPLVAGTDTPTPWIIPGASLHDELRLLHEAGIPNMDVLRIGTARGQGAGGGAQMIAPGAPANLVLLANNPLQEIANTRSIVMVIKRGEIVTPRQQPPAPRPLRPAPSP